MTNNFDLVMAGRTDAELLKILNSPEGDYQPAAVESARNEFAKRNLSVEQVAIAEQEVEADNKIIAEKANLPLGIGWIIIILLFPGIAVLVLYFVIKDLGYDRKSKEMFRWFLYGIGIRIGIFLLIQFL